MSRQSRFRTLLRTVLPPRASPPPWDTTVPVREELFGIERLEQHAESLAAAALRMWETDCGALPIVDGAKVVGMITDRDISMALALKGCRADDCAVAEVASGDLYSCSPEDDVLEALAVMGRQQVHRLPVVEDGRLAGMLTMNDVVLCGGENERLRAYISKVL